MTIYHGWTDDRIDALAAAHKAARRVLELAHNPHEARLLVRLAVNLWGDDYARIAAHLNADADRLQYLLDRKEQMK